MSRQELARQVLRINDQKVHCTKKFCGNCWRHDYHYPLLKNRFAVVILTFLTFGIYNCVRSFRCVTCGQVRSNMD